MNHLGERGYTATEMERPQTTQRPFDAMTTYLAEYARQRPGVVAIWAFGLGFLFGWRLKPW